MSETIDLHIVYPAGNVGVLQSDARVVREDPIALRDTRTCGDRRRFVSNLHFSTSTKDNIPPSSSAGESISRPSCARLLLQLSRNPVLTPSDFYRGGPNRLPDCLKSPRRSILNHDPYAVSLDCSCFACRQTAAVTRSELARGFHR